MKRSIVTAISLLAITLAWCAQASGETSEWEKFTTWEFTEIEWKILKNKESPKPDICQNIDGYHFKSEHQKKNNKIHL